VLQEWITKMSAFNLRAGSRLRKTSALVSRATHVRGVDIGARNVTKQPVRDGMIGFE
jgi:hypothetical protein